MTLLPYPLRHLMAASGLAVLALTLASAPALADQVIEAADNATIGCQLSRGELSRIALIDDGFASVSKIASGYPYIDFEVTHEPVRGDIYISVPPLYASDRVSFFATSTAGYVYRFACHLVGEDATQLFITNPALRHADAGDWEQQAGPDETAIRLIEAMAGDAVLPGFVARAELSRPRRTGAIEVQQVAQYDGATFTGQRFVIRNLGAEPLDLGSEREGPAGALAFAYGRGVLPPGETTSAFLVFASGGLE